MSQIVLPLTLQADLLNLFKTFGLMEVLFVISCNYLDTLNRGGREHQKQRNVTDIHLVYPQNCATDYVAFTPSGLMN